MSEVIDLDALVPKAATIKFGDQEIVVQPPKTSEFMFLSTLIERLDSLDKTNIEESDKLIADFESFFQRVIPELQGKTLVKRQIETLTTMMYHMVRPPEIEELEQRGITVNPGTEGKKEL